MTDEYLLPVRSPRGTDAQLFVRANTNDAATVHSTFWAPGDQLNDEYGLAGLFLKGWALDIGAHVGSVALALAIDNPDLQVIAVEAVPENAALLQRSVEFLHLGDRVHVIAAAATEPGRKTAQINYGYFDQPGIPAEHSEQVRFIGNLFRNHGPRGLTVEVPAVSLADILERYAVPEIAFTKTDAEGAEWAFFSDPTANARLAAIRGEYHDRPDGNDIRALFAATHDVTVDSETDEGIGLFRAIRR